MAYLYLKNRYDDLIRQHMFRNMFLFDKFVQMLSDFIGFAHFSANILVIYNINKYVYNK